MRKFFFFFFVFPFIINSKNLYNLSVFDLGGGYNIIYEFSLIKSGVVFEKFFNIGFGASFMEGIVSREIPDMEGAVGILPLTVYFVPYKGMKNYNFNFPIIYTYFKVLKFAFEDIDYYYRFGIGFNIFCLSIEAGFFRIKYYSPPWSIEKTDKLFFSGIFSFGFWTEK